LHAILKASTVTGLVWVWTEIIPWHIMLKNQAIYAMLLHFPNTS